ncbi:hypothetical protein L3476_07375 [Paenibacillus thiaminolyticus]|uniref:hypothetical protein n=1 Tax=Paenibacillus thiaminolyticus TaxID=49283 RepID=UPI001162811E|nr:hypothetical protein [Paenibacillus thiaminolyticus]NGP59288.1 hypothetical protein [Paenibacillus thiaminolyticus]WCR28549.1 hypothetical protein L3476_07375 [Paenibacillus thiaminolyticus]
MDKPISSTEDLADREGKQLYTKVIRNLFARGRRSLIVKVKALTCTASKASSPVPEGRELIIAGPEAFVPGEAA